MRKRFRLDRKSIARTAKKALHKKWSFALRISSVNVTKSAGNCSHLLKKSLVESFIFCAVMLKKSAAIFKKLWKFVKSFVFKIVFYQLFGCLKTKSGPLTRRNAQLPRVNHYIFTKSRQELTRTSYDDVRS